MTMFREGNTIRLSLCLLMIVGGLWGCSRSDSSSPVDTSPVVVTVDGVPLRLGEVQRRGRMIAALHRHRSPSVSEQVLQSLVRQYESGYPKYWVDDTLLAHYAEAKKLPVPEPILKECEQKAFDGLRAKGDQSFDDLAKVPGVSADLLRRQIRAEAMRQVITDHLFSQNPTNIPDSYVDEQLENIRDYNARMALTNAVVYARATNVWNRLKAGEDFVSVARAMTEVPEEIEDNCLWGTFALSDFTNDRALQTALAKLKPGEFTPPVEGDNGLMIARLDSLGDDGSLAISRIVFRLPLFYTPAPREKILAAGYDKYRKSLFARKLQELREAAVIEYANTKTTKKEAK